MEAYNNKRWKLSVAFLIVSLAQNTFTVSSFTPNSSSNNIINNYCFTSRNKITQRHVKSAELEVVSPPISNNTSGKGFAKTKDDTNNTNNNINETITKMNPTQIKEKLLNLLPRMTGTKDEFQLVEAYINALEHKFIPPQTLDFFNLAMVGEWQFLFTSNQLGRPSPKLRLTELIQKVEVDGFGGQLINQVSLT